MNIEEVDAVLNEDRWLPRRGWHDAHRDHDRTPAYLPAMMQVRSEFAGLIEVMRARGLVGATKALQLGMGECDASHHAWRKLCKSLVITIDWRVVGHNEATLPGRDLRDPATLKMAADNGPYDVVFIDAGHRLPDIEADHMDYGALVRAGGIVAFHDSVKRPGYEDEVDVWRYLETLPPPVHQIGSEVGIAWIAR